MVSSKGSQPPNAERRLRELGIELAPPPPTPFGAYVEAVQTGNLLFLSGMLPAIGHESKFIGRLGKELDANAGREAVRIAALNVLSAAKQKLRSLNKVTHVVRRCVYLATDGDSFDQPKVADAASELFRDVFGEDKTSVRVVLGVASLPLGMPLAVEVILEVEA
jgi:enamine deaminase RidA (YjgF/YER057c/UK114 family)